MCMETWVPYYNLPISPWYVCMNKGITRSCDLSDFLISPLADWQLVSCYHVCVTAGRDWVKMNDCKTYSVDVVCDLFCNGVPILLSSRVTNCCSINFGFAIFLPFIFPVVIAFLCFMHFIESNMWLFHILWWNVPRNLPLIWYASLLECEWLKNFIQWMLLCDILFNGVSILAVKRGHLLLFYRLCFVSISSIHVSNIICISL